MKTILINAFAIMFSVSLFGQDITATVKGNSKFAFELYKSLAGEKQDENLFFSPFSISSALAMTYAGARNETQLEMNKTLHFGLDQPKMHADFSSLLNKIIYQGDITQLCIANSLWAQKDYVFLEDYFNMVKMKYGAGIENVDFINNAEREKTRLKINEWIERKTNDKIKEIIQPGMLNDQSRLVLVNAIYFLGKWDDPFNKELTSKGLFHLTPKNTTETFFMNNTLGLNYFEDETMQTIEIPYEGNKFSMIIILPKSGSDIEAVEKSMNDDRYLQIAGSLKYETVQLSMPKFKTTCKYYLNETLLKLGMTISFSDYADFSGMTGSRDLKIDEVIHQAYIDVSEKVTEAAAATAVFMRTMSANTIQNKVFIADHPFMFMITETETGSILFMGKVMNPGI
jgi:serpin B